MTAKHIANFRHLNRMIDIGYNMHHQMIVLVIYDINKNYVIQYTLDCINIKMEDNLTRESSCFNSWSQQSQIYYYSKFDLFNNESEEEFYQFSIFGEKICTQLGSDWRIQAQTLYSPFISSKQVFLNLLQLWLRHHPPVNSMKLQNKKASTFSSQYVSQFKQMMQTYLSIHHPQTTLKPPISSLKAVCLGFYMTANQIWEELFQINNVKQTNIFHSRSFFKGMTDTLFKPLMVVTQKINSVFGHKKRKLNQQQKMEDCNQLKYQSCYHQFRKTMDIEKQLQRKMSDFDLEDYQVQKKKVIQKKQFVDEESPLKTNLISNVYSYVTNFLNRNPSWQIASNFVTQILDLNQISMDEGKKVKVMRPAQDFYRKLVIMWLICQQGSIQKLTFDHYLHALVTTFFPKDWENRFTVPTKYFFDKMKANWQQIKNQNQNINLTSKEILNGFICRIKGCMKEDWNHKIKMNKS